MWPPELRPAAPRPGNRTRPQVGEAAREGGQPSYSWARSISRNVYYQ